jgi:Leucine-rich repeat (LRR) protein
MLLGQSSNKPVRSENHPVFNEIRESCEKELRAKGFETEVYLIPGGIGIKILNEDYPSVAKIAHLPISEFDFSKVSNPMLENLSFFRLEGLKLSQKPEVQFSELAVFSLKRLHADGYSRNDCSILSNHPLEELSLCRTSLQSLDFLQGLELKSLFLSNNPIESIRKLPCEFLTALDLFKCPVSNLDPLGDSPIENLNISGTKICDLSALRNSPLKKLEMRATQVSDLSCLAECPIEVLLLPGSPITSIGPLSFLPINEMNVVGLELDDLTPLSTMPIKKLSISPDKLTNAQFDSLKELGLQVIMGPGDPEDQTPSEFFQRHEPAKKAN